MFPSAAHAEEMKADVRNIAQQEDNILRKDGYPPEAG
jgi:hypothetical protein